MPLLKAEVAIIGGITLAGLGVAIEQVPPDSWVHGYSRVFYVLAVVWWLIALVHWTLARLSQLRTAVTRSGQQGTPTRDVVAPEWILKKVRTATGETLVKDAVAPTGAYPFGVMLPVQNFWELMLGEIALLRRLAIVPGGLRRGRCEGILGAGGVQNPAGSLVRLDGRNLITESGYDQLLLTGTGLRVVQDFSICLMHDPILVATYHKVTLEINKTIRVDGKPLVPAGIVYDAWLRPDQTGVVPGGRA